VLSPAHVLRSISWFTLPHPIQVCSKPAPPVPPEYEEDQLLYFLEVRS